MKVVLQLSVKQEKKALPLLVRHSPGMILRNRTYIISEEAVRRLRQEGIRFKEIGRLSELASAGKAVSGERI